METCGSFNKSSFQLPRKTNKSRFGQQCCGPGDVLQAQGHGHSFATEPFGTGVEGEPGFSGVMIAGLSSYVLCCAPQERWVSHTHEPRPVLLERKRLHKSFGLIYHYSVCQSQIQSVKLYHTGIIKYPNKYHPNIHINYFS